VSGAAIIRDLPAGKLSDRDQPMRHRLLLAAACMAVPLVPAAAEPLDQAPIIVTGEAVGYRASDTASAMRTDTPLIDVPQTLSIITRAQIDDQAQQSLGAVLRYVPGVTIGQGEGNRDQITIRGQNTTADFFTDGVRDDIQYFRPLYNLERVEVLKGPNALIFGRGGGGVVNRVLKTPVSGEVRIGGDASVDSFGDVLVSGDVNLPAGENAAVRVNAFYESLDNHRDYFGGDRWAISPYLGFRLRAGWTMGLSYEHIEDERVTDRGVPSLAGTAAPIQGYTRRFFGVPGVNRTEFNADVVRARLDGQLADNLSWSTKLFYGDFDKVYTNVYPRGPATSPTGTVPVEGYSDPTTRESLAIQTYLVWKPKIAGTGHTILAGFDYSDQTSENERYNAVLSSGSISLTNPIFPTVTFPNLVRRSETDVEVISFYAQDQIKLTDWLELVAGVRWDRFTIEGTDFIPNPDRDFSRTDEKVSPRLGLILKPRPNISVYGSYAQSFLPRSGDQFLSLTPTQENLVPEKFTNYEIGAKWDITPGLAATVALFRLDRSNATTPDPDNPSLTINAGATRTKGLEAGLTGRILPHWQASVAYSYQDAALRDNDDVTLAQVPKHQFAAWNRYDFTKRFGAGVGIVHQSAQFAAIRTSASTTQVPGFTRVDLALYLKASEKIDLQVNIENLTDAEYFSDAHNNNNISPGAPINARFSARARF